MTMPRQHPANSTARVSASEPSAQSSHTASSTTSTAQSSAHSVRAASYQKASTSQPVSNANSRSLSLLASAVRPGQTRASIKASSSVKAHTQRFCI